MNFVLIFIIISIIFCRILESQVMQVMNNSKQIFNLTEETKQILLPIESQPEQKMIIELSFSHPSRYNFAFNQYDDENDPLNHIESYQYPLFQINPNIFTFDEDNENNNNNIIHLRRLSTNFSSNQSGIISEDLPFLGKGKIVLNLTSEMKEILLTIFKKENMENNGDDKVYIKYKFSTEEEKEKYFLEDSRVNIKQDKDILNISFCVIRSLNENISNFNISYDIKLFDKKYLYTKYENIYFYSFIEDENTTFAENIELKGNSTNYTNSLKIKAPLNNKNEQILLINAKIKNESEEEIFQYEYVNFTVKEQSKEDDDEENKKILLLIMICFTFSVIATFIVVMIYLKCFAKKELDIDESDDYNDVGGIMEKNKEKKDDQQCINEEED